MIDGVASPNVSQIIPFIVFAMMFVNFMGTFETKLDA